VVVEHDPAVMWAADRLLDMGPGPGERGGNILFWGSPSAIEQANSLTADYLLGRRQLVQGRIQGREVSDKTPKLIIEGARENNLKNISVSLPLQRLVCLTGVSGSGKSTLMQGILLPALLKAKGKTSEAPGDHDRVLGDDWIEDVVHVDQSPIGKTARSNPVSYVGAFEGIRKRFAALHASRERSYSAGTFSFNSGNGRCPTCSGSGFEHIEMQFLSDVYLRCPDCDGRRFRAEVLEVKERGKSVADVLAMTVAEALVFFERDPEIRSRLESLVEVGLEYLSLGQPVPSLSGGEAQRLKLAGFLAQAAVEARSPRRRMQAGRRAGTLFLFDEPTTGLHFDDIRKLLNAFQQLLDAGHSLLVIEHNLDVISACDWVIDLGPEAGDAGGQVVACDTPQGLQANPRSHTGRALANYRTHRESQPPASHTSGNRASRLQANEASENHIAIQAKVADESSIRLRASDAIVVHHAREHNLKQLNVQIPRNKMTVITGPSGSGKSSLAFDVIFGEGQRRYLESLNAYARQFVQPAAKPDVEGLYGIPPTVAIEQRSSRGGQKSTVATLTEVYHFLRLLWMRLGTAHCPSCQIAIEPQRFDQLAARMMRDYKGRWIGLFAPLVSARKGIYKDLARWALDKGYSHFRVDGHLVPLQPFPSLDRYQEHSIELPVSSLRIESNREEALREALQSCLELGKGTVLVLEDLQDIVDDAFLSRSPAEIDAAFASRSSRLFSTRRACSQCGLSLPEPDPRLFSFNSKIGACQSCQGTGLQLSEAIRRQLDEQQQFGAQSEETLTRSEALIDQIEADLDCRDCHGERLNPIARAVRLSDKSLGQLSAMSVTAARAWFAQLKLNARAQSIAKDVLSEVHSRLEFLERVGLGYLHLNRSAPSLSGGEAQRIRLAAQLGSNLQGVCYVLDEPTIGLHPRDNKILVDTLQALRDRGNTLLVVEHDEETIRRADHLIDIGPGAGRLGGTLMASGSPMHVLEHDTSLTAKFLREPLKHPMQARRAVPANHPCIEVSNVSLHNLKNVSARIPLGRLTVITGVSGSGKSTLARDVLLQCAQEQLPQRSKHRSGPGKVPEKRHESPAAFELAKAARKPPARGIDIKGLDAIDRVLEVDQTPIGKTPRSCPATYVGFWDAIRKLFADTEEARIRGWDASRFSFNTGAGRCTVCEGQGQQTIEMNFLPDVKMLCEGCKGARFNPATLEVRWQGLSIGDVLAASVDEALGRFEAHPSIHRALQLLQDVGLGYLSLGQPSPSLSGGEAQRIKLVTELAKAKGNDGPKTLYVLDEPTVGLHMADVEKLIRVFHRLVDAGHSLVVVEHDMDIWAEADWLIDLGPDGGDGGGNITMQAPPEKLAKHSGHTGRLLGAFLNERRPLR
jgi:excinuclease ABC subunit A